MCIMDDISHRDSLRVSLISLRKPMTKAIFLKLSVLQGVTLRLTG
jgi:hypothetical protein